MVWFRRLLVVVVVCAVLYVGGVFAVDRSLPLANTRATRFDTLIVLGYQALPDGAPSPEMRERVLEGVREYRAGVAPRIVMTGGAAHNDFVEAHVMATLAAVQGVPPECAH